MSKIKRYVLFFCIFAVCLNLIGCAGVSDIIPNAAEENMDFEFGIIEIFVFGISDADAVFITTENYTAMIDTGENKHGDEILNYIKSRGINKIDYLILTHFHKDHIGGAHILIDNLEVKKIITPNYGKESKHYERFANAVNNAGTEIEIEVLAIKDTLKFTLDGAEFAVYPPQSEYRKYGGENDETNKDKDDDKDKDEDETDENNYSLVIRAAHGGNNFLFAGDAKAKRLKELLSNDEIITADYDYLKVPHHGRYNKRSLDFIYAIRPKNAVITCALNNPADERVINALENIGADIYFTPNGGVYCKSDGKSLTIQQIQQDN